jgi:sporulation protein YlmC with PRC-barrel domain
MEKFKEIPIEYEGKQETVTIKRLTYGDKLAITRKSRTVKFVGSVQDVRIDEEKYAIEIIRLGIMKAPFPLTDEGILGLDMNIGDMLLNEIEKFNGVSKEKKSVSATQSD